MRLYYVIKKEFIQLRRNKFLLSALLLLPIFDMLFLPWAATFDQKEIPIIIIDNQKSNFSNELINKISASPYFRIINYSNSFMKSYEDVHNGEANIMLEIPNTFEKLIINNKTNYLSIYIDALNGQTASMGLFYLSEIIYEFNDNIIINKKFKSNEHGLNFMYLFNPEMNYQKYMVPGIIVIIITFIGCTLSALNIVKEKEDGTIEQINVSPLPKSLFILGKLIPFWIIGLISLTICLFLAKCIYQIIPSGDLIALYIFTFLYLVAMSGLGLTLSNFSKTQQQTMFLIMFFEEIFILVSGLFTPVGSLSNWTKYIVTINPLKYYVEVVRMIYLKGCDIYDILPHLCVVMLFIIIFISLSIITYKKIND